MKNFNWRAIALLLLLAFLFSLAATCIIGLISMFVSLVFLPECCIDYNVISTSISTFIFVFIMSVIVLLEDFE